MFVDEKLERISASRIIQYADCSLKYKYIYIDKNRAPAKSVHLAYGSAIHKGLEYINRNLANGLPDLEDVFQEYDNCWFEELEKMGIEKEHEGHFGKKLYPMGLNSLETYYNNNIDYEVIGTEFSFAVPYNDEFALHGFIDAIIKRKSQIIIIDYKTSKQAYTKFNLDTSIQLPIYAYAFRRMLEQGKFPNIKKKQEDKIGYYVIIKDYDNLENNQIKLQQKEMTETHFNKMHYIIDTTMRAEDNGIFIPNYNSNCQWCEFKKQCVAFPDELPSA
jgi:CRISPR/Cas system-associated exonuclease Cas4 (RecB family)